MQLAAIDEDARRNRYATWQAVLRLRRAIEVRCDLSVAV